MPDAHDAPGGLPPEPHHFWGTRLGIKFYRYRTLLRERWWIVAVTVGAGLLAAGFLLFIKPTAYESVGRLMVSERLNLADNSQFVEEQSNFAETQVMLMQSPDVIERTRRRLVMEGVQLSGTVAIDARVEPRTSIFTVSGVGADPLVTQRYVDTLMEEFINYKRERRRDTSETTATQISEELGKLRGELRDQEEALRLFVEQNNMAFWEEQGKTAARFLSDLKTQQANLLTELHRLETLSSEELLNRPMTGSMTSTGGEGVARGDPSIGSDLSMQYLEKTRELVQKQAELAERSRVWKPQHPRYKALEDEIANLKRLLETLKQQTAETSSARISAIKAELASLEASIASWEEKVLEASRKDAEYQRLTTAVNRTQNLYEKLLLSMQAVEVGKNVTQETLQIMQRASPAKKVSRGVFVHLFLGLLFGFVAGSGVLVLLDRADDRFSSSSEIVDAFAEPILAQIPNVEAGQGDAELPLLQPDDDRYMYAEAFRSLRSSLLFMPGEQKMQLLLVTSAIPGEGKSTVASNLAITIALAGSKVLLVDADLRRGDLARLFDCDGRLGLSSLLRDECPWRDALQPTRYPSLNLLPRGPVTNQSSELILAGNLEGLLAAFREAFDFVVFNTSPILATDDTPTLAPRFDGTLLVLRAGLTSLRSSRHALDMLYQRQVRVLGLVLNGIDTRMPDYCYYRYPKYYAAQ